MSIPSRVKVFSHLSGMSLHKMSLTLKFRPKGITFVLSRFACSPEISLKRFMYFTQALRELIHLCKSKDVSSAKVCAQISS